uniref:DUF4149 domain-containing protein n=1 Tax=Caenorhabditis tropicalis TaxID=1561998 RepID=A0A1I7TNP0_9PELO
MCTVSYEKMSSEVETISIFRRIRKIDFRVWFFMLIVGSIAFDVTKLEYLVQYGFKINTIHIPIYLIFNAFLMYAAIWNNSIAMKIIKIYSAVLLMVSTIIATLAPVWMVFEFKNGAPEDIRSIMEHGETYQMEFWQRLGYCILLELTLILDAGFYAIQMYLSRKVIQSVEAEKKDAPVEMNAFNV